ncbi:ribosome small subunit-dependent GTPase A [Massilia sp. S19_KUP03_FR1]|uniref:ribosome small subunit-dependent GTPase A n=1 Tax=Massilia sp. S19_KUP03_FR1 TaxID=3025503 RepID=UPI002FCD9A47
MIDINFASLRLIGLTHTITNELVTFADAAPDARLMRVAEVHRDAIVLHDGAQTCQARQRSRLLQSLDAQQTSLAVGDWVLVDCVAVGTHWIGARIPPQTQLARRSADGSRQPLASNVDTALLVMGLDRDFNPRRLERYIALAHAALVDAVVVLTKADIGIAVDERMAQLRQRLPASVPLMALNALDAQQTRSMLAPWLDAGQTLVLLGSSGAGKSTLTNTLCASAQPTGGVRKGDGRGRHTTTARSLHQFAGGACIIDTPGLRSWRLDAEEDALTAAFDDIDALARNCQFRDCHHQAEPGCAVRDAVDADRLFNYHKLLREVRRSQQTPLDRIAERAKWKVLLKTVGPRSRSKRA